MPKPIIVSGMQPTGSLHIGNYLGALKNWVALQNSGEYEMYFFIADLHSLTIAMDPEARRNNIRLLAAEFIAAGIDPKKSTIFVQSHVPEHAELAWIFNTVTPVGELRRMTQYKDKSGVNKGGSYSGSDAMLGKLSDEEIIKEETNEKEGSTNAGLLTYPVLQAADILLYHGSKVPVGKDQEQHLELTNVIVRKFNNAFGNYFKEVLWMKTQMPKVMSLLEPEKKMSKSTGEGHYIGIADEPNIIENKLKKAVTADVGGKGAPGVKNLLMLLKEFGDPNTYNEFNQAELSGTIRYGDLKQTLAESITHYFADFRARRAKLLNEPKKLDKILADGAADASKIAAKTMSEVHKLIGLR